MNNQFRVEIGLLFSLLFANTLFLTIRPAGDVLFSVIVNLVVVAAECREWVTIKQNGGLPSRLLFINLLLAVVFIVLLFIRFALVSK